MIVLFEKLRYMYISLRSTCSQKYYDAVQSNPSIRDTTGTKDSAPCSEVSFCLGAFIRMANYAGIRLRGNEIDSFDIISLRRNQGNCLFLTLTDVNDGCG